MKAKKHAESAQSKTRRKHKTQQKLAPENVKMQPRNLWYVQRRALEARTLDIAAVRYVQRSEDVPFVHRGPGT